MGYCDTFYSDHFVSEAHDLCVSENKICISEFGQSPGTGLDGDSSINNVIDNSFHDELVNIGIEIGDDPTIGGMITENAFTMLHTYLQRRNIQYTYSSAISYNGNNDGKEVIKNAINNNRPVYAVGYGHATVAYGYDENYVYLHTGWGYCTRTPWSTFTSLYCGDYLNVCAGFDLQYTGQHVHSNNYYSTYYNQNLCGCTCVFADESCNLQLNYGNNARVFRIHYNSTNNHYVSFTTDILNYDVSFTNVITTVNYTYIEDIECDGDDCNYNAFLSANMQENDSISFTVEVATNYSVPFIIFNLLL